MFDIVHFSKYLSEGNMACIRKDVIQRGGEINLKELEMGVKNKWQWKWLDIVIDSCSPVVLK